MTDDIVQQKQNQLKGILNNLKPIQKLRFLRAYKKAAMKCYNLLCLSCKNKVLRKMDGYVDYCDDCRNKTDPLMKEVYEMLK